jgi:hypothetical protein
MADNNRLSGAMVDVTASGTPPQTAGQGSTGEGAEEQANTPVATQPSQAQEHQPGVLQQVDSCEESDEDGDGDDGVGDASEHNLQEMKAFVAASASPFGQALLQRVLDPGPPPPDFSERIRKSMVDFYDEHVRARGSRSGSRLHHPRSCRYALVAMR